MTASPRAAGFDNTLALFREGDDFVLKRSRRYRTDVFQTLLLLQKWVTIELMRVAARCLAGPIRYMVPRQNLHIPLVQETPTWQRSAMSSRTSSSPPRG